MLALGSGAVQAVAFIKLLMRHPHSALIKLGSGCMERAHSTTEHSTRIPHLLTGLASYPIDTVRRRMMMTSGSGVHYSSSAACFADVVKNEGMKSLFKVRDACSFVLLCAQGSHLILCQFVLVPR